MAYNREGGVPSVIRRWAQELRDTNDEIDLHKSFIVGHRGKKGMTKELEAELAISANPRDVAAVLRDQVAKIKIEITNEEIERAKEEHTMLLNERKEGVRMMQAEREAKIGELAAEEAWRKNFNEKLIDTTYGQRWSDLGVTPTRTEYLEAATEEQKEPLSSIGKKLHDMRTLTARGDLQGANLIKKHIADNSGGILVFGDDGNILFAQNVSEDLVNKLTGSAITAPQKRIQSRQLGMESIMGILDSVRSNPEFFGPGGTILELIVDKGLANFIPGVANQERVSSRTAARAVVETAGAIILSDKGKLNVDDIKRMNALLGKPVDFWTSGKNVEFALDETMDLFIRLNYVDKWNLGSKGPLITTDINEYTRALHAKEVDPRLARYIYDRYYKLTLVK